MNWSEARVPTRAHAPGDELPPGQFIAAALAAGALTPADVVHHGVMVELVGRSHTVFRVSVGNAVRFFAKCFGPTRGATDGLAERERAVLSLAATRPAVAALTPSAWPWQAPASGEAKWNIVATTAVPGVEAWSLDRVGGGTQTVNAAWADLVAALIPPLAQFHKATRDLARPDAQGPPALSPVPPWGLCLMDGDAAPELWATPALAALLRKAATDPVLVARLREARTLWRPLALIHADLKHDNLIAETTPDGLRVRVLDWEMARLGDPAWDLATLTARLAALAGEAPPWPDTNVAAAARLIRAYAEASGLRIPALSRRVAFYVATVLLMQSLQHASMLPADDEAHAAQTLLMKARATFAGVDALTDALIAGAEGKAEGKN
jgi:hypothetical protein